MNKLFSNSKKGQLAGLTSTAVGFGIAIILVVIMAVVVANVGTSFTANTASANATTRGLTGISNIGNQLGLLGTIIVFSAIIALVVAGFVVFARR